MNDLRLRISASPHLKAPVSTPSIMWNVVGSLMPILAIGTYFFGPSALLVVGAALAGAVFLTSRMPNKYRASATIVVDLQAAQILGNQVKGFDFLAGKGLYPVQLLLEFTVCFKTPTHSGTPLILG